MYQAAAPPKMIAKIERSRTRRRRAKSVPSIGLHLWIAGFVILRYPTFGQSTPVCRLNKVQEWVAVQNIWKINFGAGRFSGCPNEVQE
jgi:hypothetical protein